MQVKHLDHLNLTVADFEKTRHWYSRLFGFQLVEEGIRKGRHWGVLKSGEALLCIYEEPSRTFLASSEAEKQGMHTLNHFSFRIQERALWEATIQREQARVHHTYRYPHSSSWYLFDPTGYEIEVVLWDGDQASFDGTSE